MDTMKIYYDGEFVGVSEFDRNEVIDSLITIKNKFKLGRIQSAHEKEKGVLYITSK